MATTVDPLTHEEEAALVLAAAIFRDAAWLWFRGGLTAGDVLRLSGRLYRAGDRRYAADLLSVLGAHLLTLGHSELQGEKGDRTGGGP